MTAPMTAVATATASVARLYPIGSVPASPTYPYGVYSASLGRGDVYTLDSVQGIRFGRVTFQTFGHTADAALDHMDKVAALLQDKRLTISGWRPTPSRAELDPRVVRDPDDSGVVGVTATWTFTATKET
jgi:hypothetical protein